MDCKKIEKKWQQTWEKNKTYKFNKDSSKKKYYVLEMLPYPSGAKLHVGHWYNYGPSDTFARFKRMQGYNVFHTMGFDAFGLPAENYAIKTGIHPKVSTEANIKAMEQTLREMGPSFDWDYEVDTSNPKYYKWTQWLFQQFYKNGLAYRKNAPVNWCPSCNTVLANEQIIDGHCERCQTEVIRKNLTQWFLKITNYAEELLNCLPQLDWPEKTKLMQKNWIGKSVGSEVEFTCENGDTFKVFTTRVDTLFGVSYVVLAPEHPLVDKLTTEDNKKAVEDYKDYVSKANEIERLSSTREKTGVFIGSYCINPINNKRVPIWIGDYVLFSYGTGAVMGVPAHDERDFDFAKKYNLPITRVVKGKDNQKDDLPFVEYGLNVNSAEFDNLETETAQLKIVEKLEKMHKGSKRINYRLRDWLVSRQRYWGCPIPIIHCPKCGEVLVEEKDLPVLLPENVDFTPDGKSPLLKCDEFMNVKCPKCGCDAKREADTLDTFICSSWYFLRYPDANNSQKPFDKDIINSLLPVDKYIGGAEHACMHLLYARFFTKALRDMGFLNFDEPFTSLVHQGTILGPDGMKMSKSRGNVISPDDYVSKIGADPFRLYLMFGFSYTDGGPWNSSGIESIVKFIDKIEKIVTDAKSYFDAKTPSNDVVQKEEKELEYIKNNTIKCVTEDLEKFSFNTAIARIMEFVNAITSYVTKGKLNNDIYRDSIIKLILIFAPFAPHVAEELNEVFGITKGSVFDMPFPTYNEKALIKDEYELAVQINSKIRSKIIVSVSMTNKQIEEVALSNPTIQKQLEGKTILKCVVIPKRLVNFVVK